MNKGVFIDRDGTINVNVEYLDNPEDFQMYHGVGEGIKKLRDNGFKIIVITNQSGISRGFFTEETLDKIHKRMEKELLDKGVKIDGIYYCPHHQDEKCNCRKPNTALFKKALKEHDIDPNQSYVIGDRMLDVEAGHKIGSKTILVPERVEQVELEMKKSNIKPDCYCENFEKGVEWILKNHK